MVSRWLLRMVGSLTRRNLVPTGAEPAAQVFRAGLEPAVTGRHTSGAEHRDTDQGPKDREVMRALQIILHPASIQEG